MRTSKVLVLQELAGVVGTTEEENKRWVLLIVLFYCFFYAVLRMLMWEYGFCKRRIADCLEEIDGNTRNRV
ncbi:Protein RICE SALT SENSITIVE 3 [Camellia lanceoleosa]|uniref:Protein RICE SALT SENSITIVE 3 n=1 Tax=Camellia lanceoleosa TaxID=1840588 RepID=A0ACC0IFD0_9ERIC|nr:Protein RICE SALT SENSITIVE 3 [Camellia lanceoleosa]